MSLLDAAVERFGRRDLAVDGVYVSAPGGVSVEQHWSPDVRRDVFSCSKTVTALAIGLAEAEGLLTLDDPVLSHLGDVVAEPADGMDRVTIRHLLTMTSGIVYRWTDPDADHPGDPAADILSTPLGFAPGTDFAYRGGSSYLLSRIVHACSGADLRDFLLPRLFAPLRIGNPQWLRCPLRFSIGAVGLHLRTEELGRITGLLLGAGASLVPSDFVASMTTDAVDTGGHLASNAWLSHPENARYGRGVWLCTRDDAWRMDGIHGQFGIVLPDLGATVTITAHYTGPTTDILDAVWSDIVPVLR